MFSYMEHPVIKKKSILLQDNLIIYNTINQAYFCDGTSRYAVPEVPSRRDASRKGVPEPFMALT
jgi:hypothetical protein